MPYALTNNKEHTVQCRKWVRESKNDPMFAYATGRIRVLENNLLKHEELTLFSDRMTNLAILNDILDKAHYPLAKTLDGRFVLEERQTDAELKEMAGRTILPRILLLEKDYHNAKWMLKQLMLAASAEQGSGQSQPVSDLNHVDSADKDESVAENHEFSTIISGDEKVQREALDAINKYFTYSEDGVETLDTRTFNTENILQGASKYSSKDGGQFTEELSSKLIPAFIPHEQLWKDILAVMSGSFIATPCDRYLISAIVRTAKAYLAWRDLSLVDIVLDKAYYEELFILANDKDTGSEKDFILDFCALKADAINFQTLLRTAKFATGRTYLRQVLLPCGNVDIKDIVSLYESAKLILNRSERESIPNSEYQRVQAVFANSMASPLVKHILKYSSVDEIRELGRDIDNLIMDLAKKGLRSSYAAETVAGYWFAKQMEVKNIRIMYACRNIDLSYEDTVKLLRKEYNAYD